MEEFFPKKKKEDGRNDSPPTFFLGKHAYSI